MHPLPGLKPKDSTQPLIFCPYLTGLLLSLPLFPPRPRLGFGWGWLILGRCYTAGYLCVCVDRSGRATNVLYFKLLFTPPFAGRAIVSVGGWMGFAFMASGQTKTDLNPLGHTRSPAEATLSLFCWNHRLCVDRSTLPPVSEE